MVTSSFCRLPYESIQKLVIWKALFFLVYPADPAAADPPAADPAAADPAAADPAAADPAAGAAGNKEFSIHHLQSIMMK